MRYFAAIALLVACQRAPGPSRPSHSAEAAFGVGQPRATPGERMSYRVQLGGVTVASYELAVGEVQEFSGHRVMPIQGVAKSVGFGDMLFRVDDRLISWIDVENGRPLRFESQEYESRHSTIVEHVIGMFAERTAEGVPVTIALGDAEPRAEVQVSTEPEVWDYNAWLFGLRSWEAKVGSSHVMDVFRSRWVWRITTTIGSTQSLVTTLGEFPTLRFDCSSYKLDRNGQRQAGGSERKFSIWVSDDGDRVPLKISAPSDYGDIVMEIVEYDPGNGSRRP